MVLPAAACFAQSCRQSCRGSRRASPEPSTAAPLNTKIRSSLGRPTVSNLSEHRMQALTLLLCSCRQLAASLGCPQHTAASTAAQKHARVCVGAGTGTGEEAPNQTHRRRTSWYCPWVSPMTKTGTSPSAPGLICAVGQARRSGGSAAGAARSAGGTEAGDALRQAVNALLACRRRRRRGGAGPPPAAWAPP